HERIPGAFYGGLVGHWFSKVGVLLLIHVGYVEVVFAVCNPNARFPPRFSLDGVDELVEVGAEPVEVVGGYGSSGGSLVFPAFVRGICFPQLLQNLVGHLVVPSSMASKASDTPCHAPASCSERWGLRSRRSVRTSAAICFRSAAS